MYRRHENGSITKKGRLLSGSRPFGLVLVNVYWIEKLTAVITPSQVYPLAVTLVVVAV
jgi:hypothetical protein